MDNGSDKFDKPIGMLSTSNSSAFTGVFNACLLSLPFMLTFADSPEVLYGFAQFLLYVQQWEIPLTVFIRVIGPPKMKKAPAIPG